MEISESVIEQVREHAARTAPKECCGLVVVFKGRQRYVPCTNAAESGPDRFVIPAEEYAAAEDIGDVMAIVHSHVNEPAIPSEPDLVMMERTQLPWLIVNHPNGTFTYTKPCGYEAPLIGRQFCHGVLDCYATIRDYYARELKIYLPDFERPDNWWFKGLDLFRENFEKAGFRCVDEKDMKPHDVILMQVVSGVPDHGGVYVGRNQILHHVTNRLSSRDIYDGYWRKVTTHVLRHKEL